MPFTYEPHNAKSLSLKHEEGGKTHPAHKELVDLFSARWYTSQQHWLISKEHEAKLKNWIKKMEGNPVQKKKEVQDSAPDPLTLIQSHVRSRKDQKKYHRSISSGDGDEEEVIHTARTIKAPSAVEKFAEKFTVEPEIKSSDGEEEYDYYSSDSSAGFPDPRMPRTEPMSMPITQSVGTYYHQPTTNPYYPPPPHQGTHQIHPHPNAYYMVQHHQHKDHHPTEPVPKKKTKKSRQIKELTKQVNDLQKLILSKWKDE